MNVEKVSSEQVRGCLIDLVQAQPALWNMRSESYRNTSNKKKEEIWAKIGAELNIDVKTAKLSWKNTRTVYQRELKKSLPKASGAEHDGSETLYTGTWEHFHKMTFLRDSVMPRKMMGNLEDVAVVEINTPTETSQPQRTSDPEFVDFLAISDEEEYVPSQTSGTPGTSTGSTSSGSAKRRTALQRSLDLEEKKIKLFIEREQNRGLDNSDDMLFLKSLLPYVSKAEDKLALRTEILNVIHDFLKGEELFRLSQQ